MQFDLQRYLEEMERTAVQRHTELVKKIDGVHETVTEHTTRLVVLENSHKNMRWLASTAVGAFLVAAAEMVLSHLGHH